jgi:hypothetical protein
MDPNKASILITQMRSIAKSQAEQAKSQAAMVRLLSLIQSELENIKKGLSSR